MLNWHRDATEMSAVHHVTLYDFIRLIRRLTVPRCPAP